LNYSHADENCAIIAGYRYRGVDIAALEGFFLYGDFCSAKIWGAKPSGGGWTSTELYDADFFLPTFGEDAKGELYVTDLEGGVLYKIVGRSR